LKNYFQCFASRPRFIKKSPPHAKRNQFIGFAMSRIIKLPEVIKKTGLGRTMVLRFSDTGEYGFPRKIKLCAKAVGWLESEVDQWIEERAAQRDEVAE
jgi:prophage regulatory protein